MENTAKRIHPLVAGASVSVILVSLVGVAAITGLLPNSHGNAASRDGAPVAALSAPAVAPAPSAADVAANSAARDAARAVDDRSARVEQTEPVKPARQHQQLARPKPVHEGPTRVASQHAGYPVTSGPAPVAAAPAPVYAPPPQQVAQAPVCYDCGRVESVRAVQSQQAPSGVGVVGGAVLGGLLGNQVGGGNGKALATVAGAVGGGYAGNEIEKRSRSTVSYQVRVRMEDGQVRSFPYNNQPSWNVGDRVRVVDGYLRAAA